MPERRAPRPHASSLFPDLERFRHARAGTLSGGQKQMLAIARAFVNPQRLLLIDEPSKGLAPIVVEHLIAALRAVKHETTVLLVEQNFAMAEAPRRRLLPDRRRAHRAPGAHGRARRRRRAEEAYLGI